MIEIVSNSNNINYQRPSNKTIYQPHKKVKICFAEVLDKEMNALKENLKREHSN